MKRNPWDLAVCHCVILKWKFAVRKHELRIVLLSTFDSPWRINKYNIKFADLLPKELPIKIPNITIDIAITRKFLQLLSTFIKNLQSFETLLMILLKILIHKWKLKSISFYLLTITILLIVNIISVFSFLRRWSLRR